MSNQNPNTIYVSFAHQRHHAQTQRSDRPNVLLRTFRFARVRRPDGVDVRGGVWFDAGGPKRPKLVDEMSCRSGTWVYLRCTLNATSAPFLERCVSSRLRQRLPRTEAPVISTDSPASKSAPDGCRFGLP